MRKLVNIPRGKGLGFSVFFVVFFVFLFCLLQVTQVAAAADVTLSASAFSDSDGEDTFSASEWVVRDSDSTVYDQVAGAVTSVTISGSTFTSGIAYYWSVRYQDQHGVWSDYSLEGSFIYNSSETPTPTPSISSSTSTSTPTSTPTPSPSTTASCVFGWKTLNGEPFCGDNEGESGNEIYVP